MLLPLADGLLLLAFVPPPTLVAPLRSAHATAAVVAPTAFAEAEYIPRALDSMPVMDTTDPTVLGLIEIIFLLGL